MIYKIKDFLFGFVLIEAFVVDLVLTYLKEYQVSFYQVKNFRKPLLHIHLYLKFKPNFSIFLLLFVLSLQALCIELLFNLQHYQKQHNIIIH